MIKYRETRVKDRVVLKTKEGLFKIHGPCGETIDYSDVLNNYRGILKRYIFKCVKHGEFEDWLYRALPGPRMSLILCPMCRKEQFEEKKKEVLKERIQRRNEQIHFNMKLAIKAGLYSFINVKGDIHEAFRKALYKRHPKGYDFSNAFYKGCNAKFDFVCEVHGPGETTVKNIRSCSSPCLKCGVENKWNAVRMDLKYIEDYIAKKYNGMYTVVKETFETGTKNFDVMCKEHGRWSTTWRTLKVSGCRKCSTKRSRLTYEEFLTRANELHRNKYTYARLDVDYFDSYSMVNVICPIHGVFTKQAAEHIRATGRHSGCNRCSCGMSKGERNISDWLTDVGIVAVKEFKFERSLLRFDFMLPNSKILIEYDGEQHYVPIIFFGGVDGFRQRKMRDAIKEKLAKKYKYTLIRIRGGHHKGNKLYKTLYKKLVNIVKPEDFKDRSCYERFKQMKN